MSFHLSIQEMEAGESDIQGHAEFEASLACVSLGLEGKISVMCVEVPFSGLATAYRFGLIRCYVFIAGTVHPTEATYGILRLTVQMVGEGLAAAPTLASSQEVQKL